MAAYTAVGIDWTICEIVVVKVVVVVEGTAWVVLVVVLGWEPREGATLAEPNPVFGGDALSDEVTTIW